MQQDKEPQPTPATEDDKENEIEVQYDKNNLIVFLSTTFQYYFLCRQTL